MCHRGTHKRGGWLNVPQRNTQEGGGVVKCATEEHTRGGGWLNVPQRNTQEGGGVVKCIQRNTQEGGVVKCATEEHTRGGGGG